MPKLNILSYAGLAGLVIESGEALAGTCGIWIQEMMILALIIIISLKIIKNWYIAYIGIASLVVFYGVEIYEQTIQKQICGVAADGLNPLLVIAIIIAISTIDIHRKEK